jgi:hypothetical protein
MRRLIQIVIILAISSMAIGQNTNSWIPNGNGSWTNAANWSLGHVPLATEKVVVDKNKSLVISDVPTTSIAALRVANVASKTVTLQAGNSGNTLTITGVQGLDLDLTDNNVVLNFTGGLHLIMGEGTTGQMEKTFSGNNVTLMPAAVFTIDGNGTPSFTANNLKLKAGPQGPASLVVVSVSNPIFIVTDTTTVEQYLTGSQWHYISSPVEDATAGVFCNDYLRYYDEPAGEWSPFIVPTDPPMGTGQGYEAWTNVSSTKVFHGNLHSGDITVDVTRSWIANWTPADTNGWNLVGNPYPSAVDWQSDGLTLNHIDPTIYYWNGSSYVTYNRITHLGSGSRYIPPMQAFFVHVTRNNQKYTAGSLKFTNEARADANIALYKDAPVLRNVLSLRADGNGYADITMISLNDSASVQFDWQLDNMRLPGNSDVPGLYSELGDGTQLAVNSLPWTGNTTIVPVSLTCGVAGSFSITAGDLDTFDPGVEIFLKDILANSVVNLREDSIYTFTHDPQFNNHRFEIQFFNPSVGNPEGFIPQNGQFVIYAHENEVFVKQTVGHANISGELVVTDMLGREVFRTGLRNEVVAGYPVGLGTGYYIASVVTAEAAVNQKVWLH